MSKFTQYLIIASVVLFGIITIQNMFVLHNLEKRIQFIEEHAFVIFNGE